MLRGNENIVYNNNKGSQFNEDLEKDIQSSVAQWYEQYTKVLESLEDDKNPDCYKWVQ